MDQYVPYGDPGFLEAYGNAWSQRDTEPLLRYFADDGEYTDTGSSVAFRGHAEIARFVALMFAFSHDSRVEYTSLLSGRDGFAAEWTWSGTASGKLVLDGRTYPRTDRPFSVNGVALCKVDASRAITSHVDYYDMRALLKQLDLG
jgi:steroid delta-isomerase-like uncharacterized protein